MNQYKYKKIIWSAFVVSLLLSLYVGAFQVTPSTEFNINLEELFANYRFQILFAAAMVEIILAFSIRKIVESFAKTEFQSFDMLVFVTQLAFAETAGLLGVVAAALTGRNDAVIPFGVIALVSLFYFRPKNV